MLRTFIISLLFSLLFIFSYAQDNDCKVLLIDLEEEYTGECKKGLAHGDGTAIGNLGEYIGKFKKGFPDGRGRLNYKRTVVEGSYYDGEWSRGMRNGEGTFYYSEDSITTGYWGDDVYLGKYLSPYKVTSSQALPRFKFTKNNKNNPNIEIQFRRNGVRTMADIITMNTQISSGTEIREQNYLSFENIEFPFEGRLTLTINNKFNSNTYYANFNFEIYEEANWVIVIDY
jgi:hypothetical protein